MILQAGQLRLRFGSRGLTIVAMSSSPSDESLMLRYRDGDLQAFRLLHQRHTQGLYQFIAWRSPRREWVEEIVQDSWTRLHHARERYRPQGNFRTYLFQIALNRLIDQVRQQGRIVLASELHQYDDGNGSHFDALADDAYESVSPEALLGRKQQMATLHAAIAALPGEQKDALILQQFNGMSLEEIAAIVCAPVETVKSRLRYAMRKLRAQLESADLQRERT